MDRRDFLIASASLGAGALASGLVPGNALASALQGPEVVVATGPDPAATVGKALAALGGMKAFVAPGDVVVVKPNIGWDRTPEQAANTHPEVVRAVTLACLDAGAKKVNLFDRTCNDPRRCYVNSGIARMVEELGDARVELSQIDERKFRKVEIPGGEALPSFSFYEEALSADKFINVPVAKHHSASVLTLAMKNVMGVIGQNRAVLHRILPGALVDLNRALKSHLTLIDATRILVANGPQGGRIEDVRRLDTIVAGTDIVAVDAVAATLFGKTPDDVPYVKLAHEKGLGVADLSRIRVTKVAA